MVQIASYPLTFSSASFDIYSALFFFLQFYIKFLNKNYLELKTMNNWTGSFHYFITFISQIIEILPTGNYETIFHIKNLHVFVFFSVLRSKMSLMK